jgi:prolyl oligopeptidase
MLRISCMVAVLLGSVVPVVFAADDDPYLWLEEIDGVRAMEWVKAQNDVSTRELSAVPEYGSILERNLEILDSQERIPTPTQEGRYIYNFWQDAEHERGILRRTSLASYRSEKPDWETVLDIDALSKAEGTPWVYKGRTALPPDYRRAMISLSSGGGDAVEMREFDLVARDFVKDGFYVPVAKQDAIWKDENTLWIASDFGAGSMSTSGYPLIVKEWKRGTPLTEARTVFTARAEDVYAFPLTIETPQRVYSLVIRAPEFFKADVYLQMGDKLERLPIPLDAEFQGIFKGQLLFSLRSDWTAGARAYRQGALLAGDLDDMMKGAQEFRVLFEPSEKVSLADVEATRDRLLMSTLDNVHSRLYRMGFEGGEWTREEIGLPGLGSVGVTSTSVNTDDFFLTYEDFLTPGSLFLVEGGQPHKLRSLPAFFDADGMKVSQREASSKDGTRIPYFLVTPKAFQANGKAPTLLYGYGGFEVAMDPSYSATVGASWLERGGVFVLANLRGGGEFGPRWHEAALRENRIKSFEDFIAVAEDLIATRVTSPEHLGIMGGSQGGLLVGGAFTMRPDLFKAVVCQVPLLDMKRFNKLLAGASWMAEYGNPDVPEDWKFIQTWSPYQLVKPDVDYPKVFFWTNTRDDRVHPGHARKMVARMEEMGHPVYYFENIEGGHGAGSTNRQRAEITTMQYSYLWSMLR